MFVIQSCLALCDPMDCSPPGSSVHGILQARTLELLLLLPPGRSSLVPASPPFPDEQLWTSGKVLEAEGCFLHRGNSHVRRSGCPGAHELLLGFSGTGHFGKRESRWGQGGRTTLPPVAGERPGPDGGGPPGLATLGFGSPGSHNETGGASLSGPCDGFQSGSQTIPKSSVAPWAVLSFHEESLEPLGWWTCLSGHPQGMLMAYHTFSGVLALDFCWQGAAGRTKEEES